MTMDQGQVNPGVPPAQARPPGCGDGALLFFVTGGLLTFILAGNALAWVIDEVTFEGMLQVIPLVRPLVVAGFEILPLLVLVFLGARWKTPYYRAIYRTWAIALSFSLLLSLARGFKVTAGQAATFSQILLMVVFGLLLLALQDRDWFGGRARFSFRGAKGLPVALLLAAILSYPWAAWGALGSPVDTLLALVAGLLFGFESAWVLSSALFSPALASARKPGDRFGLTGFAACVGLFLMATGLAYTGFQWYLFLPIPALGFALYGLAIAGWDGSSRLNALPGALLAGLGAAVPLMLVDPDELSAVITSGPGELAQWVTRAGMVSLFAALVFGLILSFSWNWIRSGRLSWSIGAGAAWLAALLIYFLAGQPGFFGERLFVIFRDQADVSSARSMGDYDQRRSVRLPVARRQGRSEPGPDPGYLEPVWHSLPAVLPGERNGGERRAFTAAVAGNPAGGGPGPG